MRKHFFPRIIWFLLLNCVIFILLVAMQFPRGGNFTHKIDDLLISGRYASDTDKLAGWQPLDGGVTVQYGGLEFRLDLSEYISVLDNGAAFMLPGGVELSFSLQYINGMGNVPELKISGKFAEEDDSSVEIPFKTQRSSIVRDNNTDPLNILYRGSLYQFSRPLSFGESGQIVLAASSPVITYHTVTEEDEFKLADYIIRQAETAEAYSEAVFYWLDRNYALWSRMGTQTDENTVVAWCGEAVRRGNYRSAISAVPASFSTDPQRTWESAVYQFDRRIGVWERAARSVGAFERERFNTISRLLADRGSAVFNENRLIEFLAIRGYNDLINNFLSFVQEMDPTAVTLDMGPGILECFSDLDKWRPGAVNPFVPLAERVLLLATDKIRRDGDQVFIVSDSLADTEFNLRFGMAVIQWGEKNGISDWVGLGRSIVLSVISLGDDAGSIPSSLEINGTGSPGGRISSARLYRILGGSEYLPHATATGADGIWAWTAASSVNINRTSTLMDISVRFPVGETHYVMLRNVPSFPQLQIYGMNWRRAVDFESYYNASGWYYFEQERTLVLKLNHRSTTETVRILFTAPRAPEPEPAQTSTEQS
ncbi:MAG: hypothetical protein FWC24_01520 [Treponema sp.]|nr:hypothetical protein [Treponema sp.]